MSIVKEFVQSAKIVMGLRMPIEDVAYTLSKLDYKINTHIPKNICHNEQDFENYVNSLTMIAKSKGASLDIESQLDGKKIICIYNDLQIICIIDFRKETWNFYIERKNEKEHYYYYLAEQNTPFLYLMLLINLDAFNKMNFRYSLDKTDEDGIRLYYNKKDAINHFKEIMFHYAKDISKVDLAANETRGTLLNKDGKPLVILRNEYETDDIKLVFSISNTLMLLKIYEIVKDDYDLDDLMDMYESLGFSLERNYQNKTFNVFDRIYAHYGYTLKQNDDKSLNIISPKEYMITITHSDNDDKYNIVVKLLSSGGRICCVEKENFTGLINGISHNTNDYSFEQVVDIIKAFSELSHKEFPYTLLVAPSNSNLVYSRYRKFEYALYSNKGFFNVAMGNDYISLDMNSKSGKSYKIAEDGNKYDYVVIDKNDCIQTTYSELYNAVLNNNSKNDVLSQEYTKIFNDVLHKSKK